MWNKIKEKGTLTLYGLYIFLGVCFLLYFPIKCTSEIIDRIQNPPSEIYAENQILVDIPTKVPHDSARKYTIYSGAKYPTFSAFVFH